MSDAVGGCRDDISWCDMCVDKNMQGWWRWERMKMWQCDILSKRDKETTSELCELLKGKLCVYWCHDLIKQRLMLILKLYVPL